MGCILTLIGLVTPRLAIVGIWLFSGWFGRAYETTIWPLLGLFFMPYTVLAYMAAMLHNDGHVSGGWLALVVVAALTDLGSGSTAGVKGRWKRGRTSE